MTHVSVKPDPITLRALVADVAETVVQPSLSRAKLLTVAARLQQAADIAWKLGNATTGVARK